MFARMSDIDSALFEKAQSLLPGGVNSPVRAFRAVGGSPVFVTRAKGARIFEKSPVRKTRFTRKFAEVVLASGVIRTRAVIVATGGPGTILGQLRRHVREQTGFAVVTAPLPAAVRRQIGARGAIVTEIGAHPHWWRWVSDDRLLFAGAVGRPVGLRALEKTMVQRTAQLMYELSVRYPAISGLPAEFGWHVPIVSTLDGLPWIGTHRNYPFHFSALALGWHGDALAWLAARAAVRFAKGEMRKDDEILGFARIRPIAAAARHTAATADAPPRSTRSAKSTDHPQYSAIVAGWNIADSPVSPTHTRPVTSCDAMPASASERDDRSAHCSSENWRGPV